MDVVESKTLSKYRSEVIEKFINTEGFIDMIISQKYFHHVNLPFVKEILFDEYFSFALKRRILEKIIPNLNKEQINNLNRMNTIRNYFAHTGIKFFPGLKVPSKEDKSIVIDPRNPTKPIDYKSLYIEFIKKEPIVSQYLNSIYIELGGKVFPK